MITLPSKFATENAKADKAPAVIVKLLESELSNEQTTQADWTANVSESNVDYTPSPPDAGDVILASQADSITSGASSALARYDHTSVNIGGVMYAAGGVESVTSPKTGTSTFQKYNISTGVWTGLTNMALGRTGHMACSDGVNLMYLGGGRPDRDTTTASTRQDWNVYNVTTGVWSSRAALPVAIFDSVAGYLNGKVYIVGGRDETGKGSATLHIYDDATNSWSTGTAAPRTFDRHAMVVWAGGGASGQLVIFGGQIQTPSSTATNEVWIYDIATDSWSQSTSGPVALIRSAAAIIGDRMFIVGGKTLNVTPAIYYPTIWEMDLSKQVWSTRLGLSAVTARATAVPNGTDVVVYGGRTPSTVSAAVALYHIILFQTSGWITVKMDLGAVPTVNGEWVLSDITPASTTLTYQAWGSATGAFAGEETALGTILDGDAITQLFQHYEVKTTFATTDTLETPTLESIKATFATYQSYSNIPDFGYEPALINISSLTTSIDTFRPSTIGQMTVRFGFIQSLSNWLVSKYPKNKIVKILVGFDAFGWTENDFIDFFRGQVDDWSISKQDEISLTVKDFKKEWSVDVPATWNTTADDVTWTDMHPSDIILDILQNQINVRDSKIDIGSFATVKAAIPDWVVTRTITGNPEQADGLIEELRLLMSAFFVPKGDGKIKIKRWDALESSVMSLSENNVINSQWTANAGNLFNDVTVYTNQTGTGSSASDFSDVRIGLDVTSAVNYDETATKTIKDKWTKNGAELLTNGDFETGNTTGWGLTLTPPAAATFTAVASGGAPYQGSYKGQVSISNGGAIAQDVQIFQSGKSIIKDHIYKITIGVATNINYSVSVLLQKTGTTTSYAVEADAAITSDGTYRTYEVFYTANTTASDAVIVFYFGAGPTTVFLDECSFVDTRAHQTDDMSNAILARYADPPEIITLDTDVNTIALEVGDIVDVTLTRAPSTDMTGINAKKMQIVNRNMDFQKNKNRLKLLAV